MDKDALLAVFAEASNSGWSLRSDVQLQEWLERFSEHMTKRTESVVKEVQKLGIESDNVELDLQNTFNSLRALSSTQFIENRVDEEDETTLNRLESHMKQPCAASYESEILPRYKEAVLTAWHSFEGFRKKTAQSSSETNRAFERGQSIKARLKLPHIIGTDEFARDIHCGLADSKFVDAVARVSSSEPAESDSDTDRDEARMAAEMVGGGIWLEGEWSATESDASGHQGGVLEPAVSAALDFKAMLEAALRGPSLSYEDGMLPKLEDLDVHYGHMEKSVTSSGHAKFSNTPRTRSEPGEGKLDGDLPGASGHGLPFLDFQMDSSYLEDYMNYQDQGETPKTSVKAVTSDLFQPSPLDMPSPSYRTDFANMAAALDSKASPIFNQIQQSDSLSPRYQPSHNEVRNDEESSRAEAGPQSITSTVESHSISVLNHSPRFMDDKKNPFPLTSQSQSLIISENPPIPALPDGLFQGLQAAIQARENRSLSNQHKEGIPQMKIVQKLAPPGKEKTPISVEKIVAGRSSQERPKPKNNGVNTSNINIKATSNLQDGQTRGMNPTVGLKEKKKVVFQGGLFDDDDDEDDNGNILRLKVDSEKDATAKTVVESQSDPRENPWNPIDSTSRQKLFDGLDETNRGPPIVLEGAGNDVLIYKSIGSLQPYSSLQDGTDGNNTPVSLRSDVNSLSDIVEAAQIDRDAGGALAASTSQVLAAAVTANRTPVLSDSDDDTSLSWSNYSSEESSHEDEEAGQQGRGKGGNSNSVQQQSRTNGNSDDGDAVKDKIIQGSEIDDVGSSMFEGMEYNRKRSIATETRISERITASSSPLESITPANMQAVVKSQIADRSASLQQSKELDWSSDSLTMSNKGQGSSPSYHIPGPFEQKSSVSKELQANHSSSTSPAANGLTHMTTSGLEVSSVSTKISTEGGTAKNETATSVGNMVPVVAARKYRSLFDDDDNEEEDLFLPRPRASKASSAAETPSGSSRGRTVLANEKLNSSHASTSNSGSEDVGLTNSQQAASSMIRTPAFSSEFKQEPSRISGRLVDKEIPQYVSVGPLGWSEKSPTSIQFDSPEKAVSSLREIDDAVINEHENRDLQPSLNTVTATPKTVSALLFGDDDGGEDDLFGPLGGQSRGRSTVLFDLKDTAGGESFLKSVSATLPLNSPRKGSRTTASSSQIPRRSLFDDGIDDAS